MDDMNPMPMIVAMYQPQLLNQEYIKDNTLPVEAKEVHLEEDSKTKLGFKNIQAFANDKDYVFVLDAKVVYKGYVDDHDAEQTVNSDIDLMPEFYRFSILLVLQDEEEINRLSKDVRFIQNILIQLGAGQRKGEMNNHYTH